MIGRAHDHKINVFRLFVGLFHRFTAAAIAMVTVSGPSPAVLV